MGRYGKDFKKIGFKCQYEIYEELVNFKEKYNQKYNEKITLTKLLEVAIFEFIENNKDKIE